MSRLVRILWLTGVLLVGNTWFLSTELLEAPWVPLHILAVSLSAALVAPVLAGSSSDSFLGRLAGWLLLFAGWMVSALLGAWNVLSDRALAEGLSPLEGAVLGVLWTVLCLAPLAFGCRRHGVSADE